MKLIDLDNSWGEGILQDWYIHSVNPDDPPQWTDEHIEELCKDFYVIPKETTKYDIYCNPDRLKELAEADKEGRCLVLPCKVGDTINAFRFDIDKGLYVISDKVTSVTTNRNGYTIKTKEKFYPIKEKDGYDFAPISEYPGALADYYVGTKKKLRKHWRGWNELSVLWVRVKI